MALTRSQLAELLMERIYDLLDENGMASNRAGDGYDLEEFKYTIRKDVLIQLSIIEAELKDDRTTNS